ncbi:dienelactone hydrolase family protein [Collimonas arenae]|uniref:Dienelactone hydrolase family protein n=1 Tax=Collimonas arenae TaxID=279058 RepID=A0A127PRW9_9BURK|nr:dienelactone hydrolase family protein [Collimonas arenae]AMP10418.1 dienelactone hydrolase family protein [Collimonas arenae]
MLSQNYPVDRKMWVFLGSADEEVSPTICRSVLNKANAAPGMLDVSWYDGATHDFDNPGDKRQAIEANRKARDDLMQRAAGLLDRIP